MRTASNIFDWPSVASIKCKSLEAEGMLPVGVILAVPDVPGQEHARRVTVDRFGRVQWWDVDGSGKMVPNAQVQAGPAGVMAGIAPATES